MNSVSQLTLGAVVGVAVAGRCLGPRRAAIIGGVLGTLPDLDVLIPFDDPVNSFIQHRSTTHSLIIHALATPIFGELIIRLQSGLTALRRQIYLMVFLCFATHALLDAMTIYGTQLLWPLSRYPFGIGSIFIIDPLYTLPLVVATIWALAARRWNASLRRATTIGLVLSTGYLGWTLAGQVLAKERGLRILESAGIEAEHLLATPMPFNSLLWRVLAVDGERYLNLYLPIFAADGGATFYEHERLAAGDYCLEQIPAARKLVRFTKGFYRVQVEDDALVMADIRMGVTPSYVFTFDIAANRDGGFQPVPPLQRTYDRSREGDVAWLLAGMIGQLLPRPGEMAYLISELVPRAEASEPAVQRVAAAGIETKSACTS